MLHRRPSSCPSAVLPAVLFLLATTGLLLGAEREARAQAPATPQSTAARDTTTVDDLQAQRLLVRGMTRAYLGDLDDAIAAYEQALAFAPRSGAVLSALADAHAEREAWDTALFYAEQAATSTPAQPHYTRHLGELHLRAGMPAEAARVLARHLTHHPADREARTRLARAQTADGQYAEALATYERLRQQVGDATWLLTRMLTLYDRTGDADAALRLLERIVERFPDEPAYRADLARRYLEADRAADAVALYEAALDRAPGDTQAALRLASMYREQGQAARADSLMRALRSPEDGASAEDLVARAQPFFERAASDPEAATTAAGLLERALERDPDAPKALQMLGELRYRAGAFAEAGPLLERALAQDPRAPMRWFRAAAAYLNAGHARRAVRVAEEGLMLFPGQLLLTRVAGHAALEAGRTRAAIAYLEEALSMMQGRPPTADRAETHAALGLLYSRRGEHTASDGHYQDALAIDADFAPALNNYAFSLAERDVRLDEALDLAQRAVALEPDAASYLDTLGWVHYRRGDYAAAAACLQQALETSTASATVYEHMGDVQKALGHDEAARRFWQQALDRAPDRASLKDKLEALNDEG